MAVFNEPQKWAQTLGKDADVVSIPNTAGDTDPSIDKIFPSVFSIPLAQGGRAIPRSVLNGLFKLLGDWSFYQQNGGIASYSNAFDYAVGSFVKYNNQLYICIQANGVSTTIKAPTDSAYWQKIATLSDFANYANTDFSNINNTAKEAIAHNSVPSYIFDNLTLGASGTRYTPPTDGYVSLTMRATAIGQYCMINNGGFLLPTFSAPQAGTDMRLFVPVQKGTNFIITYNCPTTSSTLLFVYLNGTKHEKA